MRLLAIDPGPAESGYVFFEAGRVTGFGKVPNDEMRGMLMQSCYTDVVLEMVESYGMPVGREIFETVFWTGRFFEQSLARTTDLLSRKDVKLHLCHSLKANDASIRQALIDRFGPGKQKAIGKKTTPGPLYGITKDVWAALALAVTWSDRSVLMTP